MVRKVNRQHRRRVSPSFASGGMQCWHIESAPNVRPRRYPRQQMGGEVESPTVVQQIPEYVRVSDADSWPGQEKLVR